MASGLEGIVVADTALSDVDGERGRLIIAGADVEDLAGRAPFEEVVGRLWRRPADEIAARLGEGRRRAFERLARLGDALAAEDGMDALRGAVAQLPSSEDDAGIAAFVGVATAAWARGRQGLPPLAPDPSLSHAADVLRMTTGARADAARVTALDAYLVTVIDHGMNASTFAARVVTSTGSDAVSAITAAIGALKGPLHGGAPGPVLDMLDAIAEEGRARPWLDKELAAGRRVMGMGHRIYRVRDPRAAVLERAVAELERSAPSRGIADRLALARAVERAATQLLRERHPDRPLAANVEFYTAVLLDAIGLHRSLFSPIFATSRVAGWLAHVAEQRDKGRLIRPASRYVGPIPDTPVRLGA